MPQREFWTQAHATQVLTSFQINHTDPDANPTASFSVLDQSGKIMAWTGGFFPQGFAAWAFSDAVRAGMEAFEEATPEHAIKAFTRARTEWLRGARDLGKITEG